MKRLRRSYPREEYLAKRAALDKLVQKATHLHLNPEEHNISGESGAPIIYLDGQDGPKFDSLNRKQFDCREIKLINPTQPAIALHFTLRHKYQIERKPTDKQVRAYLKSFIEDLHAHLEEDPEDAEAQERLLLLERVHRNPNGYEVAVSNYFHFYRYPYVNYRYADGKGFSTTNTHLIASYLIDEDDEQDEAEHFPRYNVIFVDREAMLRGRPANDHARAADYLNAFDVRLNVGVRDLFIKSRKAG